MDDTTVQLIMIILIIASVGIFVGIRIWIAFRK